MRMQLILGLVMRMLMDGVVVTESASISEFEHPHSKSAEPAAAGSDIRAINRPRRAKDEKKEERVSKQEVAKVLKANQLLTKRLCGDVKEVSNNNAFRPLISSTKSQREILSWLRVIRREFIADGTCADEDPEPEPPLGDPNQDPGAEPTDEPTAGPIEGEEDPAGTDESKVVTYQILKRAVGSRPEKRTLCREVKAALKLPDVDKVRRTYPGSTERAVLTLLEKLQRELQTSDECRQLLADNSDELESDSKLEDPTKSEGRLKTTWLRLTALGSKGLDSMAGIRQQAIQGLQKFDAKVGEFMMRAEAKAFGLEAVMEKVGLPDDSGCQKPDQPFDFRCAAKKLQSTMMEQRKATTRAGLNQMRHTLEEADVDSFTTGAQFRLGRSQRAQSTEFQSSRASDANGGGRSRRAKPTGPSNPTGDVMVSDVLDAVRVLATQPGRSGMPKALRPTPDPRFADPRDAVLPVSGAAPATDPQGRHRTQRQDETGSASPAGPVSEIDTAAAKEVLRGVELGFVIDVALVGVSKEEGELVAGFLNSESKAGRFNIPVFRNGSWVEEPLPPVEVFSQPVINEPDPSIDSADDGSKGIGAQMWIATAMVMVLGLVAAAAVVVYMRRGGTVLPARCEAGHGHGFDRTSGAANAASHGYAYDAPVALTNVEQQQRYTAHMQTQAALNI